MRTSVSLRYWAPSPPQQMGELYFQIIRRREVSVVGTGMKVYPAEWNGGRSQLRLQGTPSRVEALQKILRALRADECLFESVVVTLDRRPDDYSATDVATLFYARKCYGDLGHFTCRLVETLRAANRLRTAETYMTTWRSFKHFCGECPFQLEKLTASVLVNYVNYLENRGLSRNTISFYLRVLHAIYAKAVAQNLTADHQPFKYVRCGGEKTLKRAIPTVVVRKIRDLDLPAGTYLARSRDLFLFSFYTRGMAFVDMAYLRKSDLSGGYICYHRRKTGQRLVIHYEPCMKAIVTRYDTTATPYLLPIITHSGDERRQYLSALRESNRQLKRIAKMVGFGGTLSMYVARHTWASTAKRKHVPISVISEGMGHDSETTTKIYLASLDNAVIDRANRLVLKSI